MKGVQTLGRAQKVGKGGSSFKRKTRNGVEFLLFLFSLPLLLQEQGFSVPCITKHQGDVLVKTAPKVLIYFSVSPTAV